MTGNSFGNIFRITTFGESHGYAVGVTIDNCPAGIFLDENFIQKELNRRRPGQSSITTQRQEEDKFQIISGIFDGKTTGTPLTIIIKNYDQHSQDYDNLKYSFRPSHADYTYHVKYGIRDHRGGGRASARETASRVLAGAIAKLILNHLNIDIKAYVSQVGHIKLNNNYKELDLSLVEQSIVRCPDMQISKAMITLIEKVKKAGDTIGGIVSCVISNCPAGLGEPVFEKLHAQLGKAMLSINAAKGFDYGSGFEGVGMLGSEHNDMFFKDENNNILTKTNFSGGIQGGISNGMDIYFRVAFKPVATIMKPQQTINISGEEVTLEVKGRHDPCILPRAVPIVEAMAALVIVDNLMMNNAIKLKI
jgi:chorismate synthase